MIVFVIGTGGHFRTDIFVFSLLLSFNTNPGELIAQLFSEIQEERKGVPQRVIAEKIGIDRNYYGKIENGNRKQMSLYKIIQIAEALEVPLYVLVEKAELSLIEIDKDLK